MGVANRRGRGQTTEAWSNGGGVASTSRWGSTVGRGHAPRGGARSGRGVARCPGSGGRGGGGDGGGRRVQPAALFLRAGPAVAARRLRRLRAGRHVGAGRAVRPRGGEGQQGAPGPGGARGAAAAQGGAARGDGAQPGAAAAGDVRGRGSGGAAPPFGHHAGAAGAERRRLPSLVLPQRRLPGSAGLGAPALRPVLRRHLRPRPRRNRRPGPHDAAGAGRPRRPHLRHRQRGAEGSGGVQQRQLLRGGDAAVPGSSPAHRGRRLPVLPRLRQAEILQILTPAVPQQAVKDPTCPPPPRLSVHPAPRGTLHRAGDAGGDTGGDACPATPRWDTQDGGAARPPRVAPHRDLPKVAGRKLPYTPVHPRWRRRRAPRGDLPSMAGHKLPRDYEMAPRCDRPDMAAHTRVTPGYTQDGRLRTHKRLRRQGAGLSAPQPMGRQHWEEARVAAATGAGSAGACGAERRGCANWGEIGAAGLVPRPVPRRPRHGRASPHRADRGRQRLRAAAAVLHLGAARGGCLEAAVGAALGADAGGRAPGRGRGLLVSPARRALRHQGPARVAAAARPGVAPGRLWPRFGAGLRVLPRPGRPRLPRAVLRHLAPPGDLAGAAAPAPAGGGSPTARPPRGRRRQRAVPAPHRGRRHRAPAAGGPAAALRALRRGVLRDTGRRDPRGGT